MVGYLKSAKAQEQLTQFQSPETIDCDSHALLRKQPSGGQPTVLRERSFQVSLAQSKWSRSLVVRDANALSKGLNPLFFLLTLTV